MSNQGHLQGVWSYERASPASRGMPACCLLLPAGPAPPSAPALAGSEPQMSPPVLCRWTGCEVAGCSAGSSKLFHPATGWITAAAATNDLGTHARPRGAGRPEAVTLLLAGPWQGQHCSHECSCEVALMRCCSNRGDSKQIYNKPHSAVQVGDKGRPGS